MQMHSWIRSLAWGAVAVLALGTTPDADGQTKALETTGDLTVFVTVADLHVTDAASLSAFKQVLSLLNDVIKPAFLYVVGDNPDGGRPAPRRPRRRWPQHSRTTHTTKLAPMPLLQL